MRQVALALLLALPSWGAATTHRVATASTSNATSYASGSFTPAAGDLLITIVSASGTVATGTMTDSQGLTFTKVTSSVRNASADTLYVFVSNATAAASSMTVTFNCTGDGATGTVIFVASVSGMSRTGLGSILQSAITNNGAAAGTPAATFGASALTGNVTIAAMGNGSNPAAVTPPTSWTENAAGDSGYATPASGGEYAYRDSGFTGTTITWASTSATAFGVVIVELDTTVPATTGTGWTSARGWF